jgi:hypothetical protein
MSQTDPFSKHVYEIDRILQMLSYNDKISDTDGLNSESYYVDISVSKQSYQFP